MIEHKQKALEAKIAELQAAFDIERRELQDSIAETEDRARNLIAGRIEAGQQRGNMGTAQDQQSEEYGAAT